MSFNLLIPEPKISTGRLAGYFAAILLTYAGLSTLDYQEARREECARKSNWKYQVTYDSTTDACIKELKNGTTQKN